MDLERLDQALRWWDRMKLLSKWRPAIVEAFEATRQLRDLLANGARVEWCETHRALEAVEEDPGFCWRYDGDKPCRIVSKLLIDPPNEELTDV